jgi:tryptophanyl-tRNA synthetase
MRPTGRLHIGHYFGALANWIRMQEEYDCFYFVADWHALTTDYADTSRVAQNTIEIATDWLAAGLDPAKCTMFVQSSVPEHAELHLLLSMIAPLGWLERVPTYSEQIENVKDRDLHTYGFLGYPLLQSADIVMYDADFVPVGEDQVPHVELTREIVRRFNTFVALEMKNDLFAAEHEGALRSLLGAAGAFFGSDVKKLEYPLRQEDTAYFRRRMRTGIAEDGIENFFERHPTHKKWFYFRKKTLVEPDALLTDTPRFLGTDGRRMAKSYGNAIWLSEDDESIRAKTKVMMTDPARKRRTDPGNPDVCPVFSWHQLFSSQETIAWADQGCRTAGIGCIECKAAMTDGLVKWIEPIRERRKQYEAQPQKVSEILEDGSAKARKVAKKTMGRVREAIFSREHLQAGWSNASAGAEDIAAGK